MFSPINDIRTTLRNPLEIGKRKLIISNLTVVKVVAVVVGAFACLVGLLLRNLPLIGTLFLIAGAVIAVLSYEIAKMAHNGTQMLSGGFLDRGAAALTTSKFVDNLFKGTLVAGPFLSDFVKANL